MDGIEFGAAILKADDERRIAYGWASLYESGGEPIVDRQGDVLDEHEVQSMAHRFIRDVRIGKTLHKGPAVGEIVESVVLTREVQKALGIDLGQSGWFVAMKINDDDAWRRVKSGELKAFSIGGKGKRKALEA